MLLLILGLCNGCVTGDLKIRAALMIYSGLLDSSSGPFLFASFIESLSFRMLCPNER